MEKLMEIESEVIDVDIEGEEEEACLVGRLVTDQNCNPLHLIDAMKETWKPNHGVSAMEWGQKQILFRFNNAIDRDWVLKNQPWQFEGSLFAIQKFTGGNDQRSPSSVNVAVDHTSFWARLYDVPISFMNESSLRIFLKHIGGILESVDRSGEDSIGKFMRFKMSMDITKQLVRGITIRVKGEVLWRPLKYEELPIYCFCCGTIGHCHKNCHSLVRNMKYGSGLNAPHLEGMKSHPPQNSSEKSKPAYLPNDIIENILSRLPAKSLHRFKAVSKQWKDKISDPRFAEIHLQQSKNSASRNLFVWEVEEISGYFVGEIQNNEIKFVSTIKHEWGEYMGGDILCYCDGLYLKLKKKTYNYEEAEETYDYEAEETYDYEEAEETYDHEEAEETYDYDEAEETYGHDGAEETYDYDEAEETCAYEEAEETCNYEVKTTYVVWNPCSRTYRKFQSPYPIDYNLHGICYDPLMKDYKVVLADTRHYAVFSCRYNKWSEMKEFSWGDYEGECSNGVYFNGCFYWIINFTGADGMIEFEIIYFDSRDKRLKKLHGPDCVEKGGWSDLRFELICFRGHLCLFINSGSDMRIMKVVEGNEEDSWMEMEAEFPYYGSCLDLRSTCVINENQIMFDDDNSRTNYILYDLRKDVFRGIRRRRILKYIAPFPYQENLFMI